MLWHGGKYWHHSALCPWRGWSCSKGWRKGVFGFAVLLSIQPIVCAFAQVPNDDILRQNLRIQEQQQQEQEERNRQIEERQRRAPSGQELQSPPHIAESASQKCIQVGAVSIVGMSRYSVQDYSKDVAAITQKCADSALVNALLASITNRYIKDGYTTSRAFVAGQDEGTYDLRIMVVEGRVESFKIEGFSEAQAALAFPVSPGDRLNLRPLEQGIDQLARLRSANPRLDIAPGEKPGTSIVLIRNDREKTQSPPWRVALAGENSGQSATGMWQMTLTGEADSPLGLGDFWSLYATSDTAFKSDRNNRGFGGFSSLPFDYWVFSASGGRFTYQSQIPSQFQTFSSNGVSWNGSASLERLLYRDASRKIFTGIHLRLTDTANFIEGDRLLSSSYRQVILAIDARWQQRLWGGAGSLQLEVQRGVNALGANAIASGQDGPKITFTKVTPRISFDRGFRLFGHKGDSNSGVTLRYSLFVSGQWTDRATFPASRLSLGSRATVRGFIEDGLSGDRGGFVRQDITAQLIYFNTGPLQPASLSLGVGYDVGGIIPDKADRFERGLLQGASVVLRFASRFADADISFGLPVSQPDFLRRQPKRVLLSLRTGW
jgi:hemolysin activation/secretion protein